MPDKFDNLLTEAIDQVEQPLGTTEDARNILTQIQDAREIIRDLEIRLAHLREQLIGTLGSEVRKRQPKLQTNMNGGRCTTGYRSRSISCEPDLEKGTWAITGSPFAKKFARNFPHLMQLGDDITPLAHAIADFFNDRYRSLG